MKRRVLHVLGRLDPGGVETWLLRVLPHATHAGIAFDFCVHSPEPGALDDDARSLGARVFRGPAPGAPWRYARAFDRVVAAFGPFEAVHSHVGPFSGVVLRAACKAGIPRRIAHSHNDFRRAFAGAWVGRRMYVRLMRRWIRRFSTRALACSRIAAESLFARVPAPLPGPAVCPYLVDPQAFEPVDAGAVRAALGIGPAERVVGVVASCKEQKNLRRWLEIAREVSLRLPEVRFMLVGDGPQRPALEAHAASLGIASRTRFLGRRRDVATLLAGAFDVFLLPSRYEGLGLVLVESQAAGLPVVFSDVVPEEARVIPELIRPVPLSAPNAVWAGVLCDALASPRPLDRALIRERFAASDYDPTRAATALLRAYGD